MDKAVVTYQLDGTTHHMTIIGPRISVQMHSNCTVIQVSESGDVTEAHMFRYAEYVDIKRNV